MDTPLNEVPVVELAPAFGDDYFVGPPPSTNNNPSESNNTASDRPPVLSSGRQTRTMQRSSPNRYSTGEPFVMPTIRNSNPPKNATMPVVYTPHPPSENARAATTGVRRASRRSHLYSDEGEADLAPAPPRFRPALLVSNNGTLPTTATNTTTAYTRPQVNYRPAILRPASNTRFQYRNINPSQMPQQPQITSANAAAATVAQLQNLSCWPNIANNFVQMPRFGGQPNFTMFNTMATSLNLANILLNQVPPPSAHQGVSQQNFQPPHLHPQQYQQLQQEALAAAAMAAGTSHQQQHVPQPPPPPTEDEMAKQDKEVDHHEDDEYHEVETYSDYAPAKLMIGKPHPDPVVETSSLSTVEPPDVTYTLKLPPKVIDNALLSALQLESVIYACQQHNLFLGDGETRRGFLIGDGAGVGKGRTIAGIIYENFLCGRRKSIWFSVSTDLKLDAERDLADIGARIPVHLLGKFPYGKKISAEYGVIFTTYSGLVSKSQSIRGTLGNRIGQLVSWVGKDFDGVIVFDECHKAKNITLAKNKKKQSKAAEFALEIQYRLPNARVVYASATGASETKHLGYMTRLGIWGMGTPYSDFGRFCETIEKRGVGAMELVAVDLKMRGAYIARQLSFKTTSFEIQTANLDKDFIQLYDDCVDLWTKALSHFTEAASYFDTQKGRLRSIWASFWAAHQKFFKYLCIGAKVPVVIRIAHEALANGKCVVIGLQSTGEAKTLEALEDGDINEFVSTAKATFESLIDNHFPSPRGKRNRSTPTDSTASSVRVSPNAAPSESSSTSVDENWMKDDLAIIKDSVMIKDGVVVAEVDENAKRKYLSSGKRKADISPEKQIITRNKKILDELAAQVAKKNSPAKSDRALRAKRRSIKRGARKSRVKLADDSDSDLLNPASSSDNSLFHSSSESTELSSDDETYQGSDDSESDTDVGESAVSEAESSDSDVQITAVRPKRNYELIILSSDEEVGAQNNLSDDMDPMKVHAKRLIDMQDELYAMIDALGPRLPNNTLDDLIDRLGGPGKVAEMTGRKGRVVKDEEGQISYRQRNEADALDNMNIAEKERFMKGQKLIAIISEAASSGISLQADKRVPNKRRRVHITIELPWSADRAIQQFGRTHRSNQISGPEYVFIISDLAGEKRFASIVAKRLESLGALTHGDRRATTDCRNLNQFNLSSKFCTQALSLLCRLLERDVKFADIEPDYPRRDFIKDAREAFIGAGLGRCLYKSDVFVPEPNALHINHFLNRILGMKVRIQNAVFRLFFDYMERLIARKRIVGQYDAGILELNSESGKTRCDIPEDYYLETQAGPVKCTLRNVQVERGISWDEALELFKNNPVIDSRSGFYTSTNPLTKAKMVFLLLREPHHVDMFRAYKPNTGRAVKPDLFGVLTRGADNAGQDEAKVIWQKIYVFTGSKCIHLCYFNSCKRMEAKLKCDVGLRHRYYCILSGGILTAWPYLERMVPEATNKLMIVRLKLDVNNRVIGKLIMVFVR